MKLRLMDIIVCPYCKEPFTLDARSVEQREYSKQWFDTLAKYCAIRERDNAEIDVDTVWDTYCTEIIAGELTCMQCSTVYPIVDGIPRLLSSELRTESGQMGRGDPANDARISHLMDEIDPVRSNQEKSLFNQIQLANQSNYGYEWKAFSHQYEQWDALYEKNYVTEDDTFFPGKLGLDAGCGMGRYSLPAVRRGAEIVGVDLSNAIESAYANGRHLPTFHAIQGDIFNLPFRNDTFDFAQSLGVIHITPDPVTALLSIKGAVKPSGNIYIYVYKTYAEDNLLKHYLLKLASLLRGITVKLPSNVLYILLYMAVPAVVGLFYIPSWILWHIPATRHLSKKLPYNYDYFGKRRFRDIHMNLFDRFGNPVERRYSRQQMEEWMNSMGFSSYTIKEGYGWTVAAVKAK